MKSKHVVTSLGLGLIAAGVCIPATAHAQVPPLPDPIAPPLQIAGAAVGVFAAAVDMYYVNQGNIALAQAQQDLALIQQYGPNATVNTYSGMLAQTDLGQQLMNAIMNQDSLGFMSIVSQVGAVISLIPGADLLAEKIAEAQQQALAGVVVDIQNLGDVMNNVIAAYNDPEGSGVDPSYDGNPDDCPDCDPTESASCGGGGCGGCDCGS